MKVFVVFLELSHIDTPCIIFIGAYTDLEKGKRDASNLYNSNEFYKFMGNNKEYHHFLDIKECELNKMYNDSIEHVKY
jgi:hypothetical protein